MLSYYRTSLNGYLYQLQWYPSMADTGRVLHANMPAILTPNQWLLKGLSLLLVLVLQWDRLPIRIALRTQ